MTFWKVLGFGVLGALALGCGGGVSLGVAPSGLSSDDGGGADGNPGAGPATGPYDFTCTMYFQPATTKLEETVAFRSDTDAIKTTAFPGYTIETALSRSPDAPAEATLTVSVREQETVQRFRLATGTRPGNQFGGGHGFTGLVYVGPGLQYICKAGDPATNPSGEPSAPPPAAPFHVGCLVEVRTTPGGAVERSETLDFTVAGDKSLDLGDFGLHARFWDEAFEGRAMIVEAWKSPGDASNVTLKQLFQFDRSAPIVNQLAGSSFSGRGAIGSASNRELSYICDAR